MIAAGLILLGLLHQQVSAPPQTAPPAVTAAARQAAVAEAAFAKFRATDIEGRELTASAGPATPPAMRSSAKPSCIVGSDGERSENAQSDRTIGSTPPRPSPSAPSERLAAAITQTFSTFRATDIEGRELTASSMRGRVVVLDFWATWCAPCLKEVPTYQRLRREHDASRLEIIGVSVDVIDRRGLVSWLNRQQVTWTTIHDRRGYSGELAQQFKVTSLPTTYVFDADGKMVAANVRGDRLIETVARLMTPPAR